MKLDYLEMLYSEFEVSSSNSMAVREFLAGPRPAIQVTGEGEPI